MSKSRPGVLITRPEPAASDTARVIEARGYTPHLAPMLLIQPRAWLRPPSAHQAILLTSTNAIPALAAMDRSTPVIAVGDATGARARQAGFSNVESAGRDAAMLAALTAARCSAADGALLLASGEGLGLELAADLRRRGFVVLRRVAYGVRPATSLPADILAALATKRIQHALFFSAASARAFAACMTGQTGALDTVEALAISTSTAQALAPLPWRRIRVASHPNQDELVALLS